MFAVIWVVALDMILNFFRCWMNKESLSRRREVIHTNTQHMWWFLVSCSFMSPRDSRHIQHNAFWIASHRWTPEILHERVQRKMLVFLLFLRSQSATLLKWILSPSTGMTQIIDRLGAVIIVAHPSLRLKTLLLYWYHWNFILNMKDERVPNTGTPAKELGTQEHTWIGRTTSKLRSTKSGFGVLNGLQSTDDLLPQVGDECLEHCA